MVQKFASVNANAKKRSNYHYSPLFREFIYDEIRAAMAPSIWISDKSSRTKASELERACG